MDLSSLTVENETFEAPAADPAAAPEPAIEQPAGEAGAEPAAAGPSLTDDDLEALRELRDIAPILRQALTAPPAAEQQPQIEQPQIEWDPFDPDSMRAMLEQRDQQLLAQIGQLFQPIAERHQGEIIGEAEQRAHDILTDIATRQGEFDGGNDSLTLARHIADSFMPDLTARYGPGPRAAEAALEQAYSYVRGIEQTVATKAVEQYKNQLGTLGGATGEPGSTGAAGVTVAPQVKGDETDLARHFAARG